MTVPVKSLTGWRRWLPDSEIETLLEAAQSLANQHGEKAALYISGDNQLAVALYCDIKHVHFRILETVEPRCTYY